MLCFGLNAASLAAGPEIEYASPDQSVWTTKIKENGEPDNPLLRVTSVLFSKADIPWHGKSYPASRLFAYLQDGTAQFSMLVRVPALQDCCLYSKKPVTIAEIRAYRHSGTMPIRAKEDLAGKSVITIRGYSYGGLVNFLADERNQVNNHVTQAHASAFRMLANGRADYVIDYAGPANEVLAAEPIAGVKFDVIARQEVFLVLSRTYPNAQAVMDRLEAIIATLDVDGLMANEATGDKNIDLHKAVQPSKKPSFTK